MDADFLTSWISWRKEQKLNFKAGHDYIDKIKAEENGMLVDEQGNEHDRRNIHGSLDSLEQAVAGNHREATTLMVGGLNILITGGMSWDDSPTELMDDLSAINDLDFEIYTTVGFDLPEDLYDYKELVLKIIKTENIRPLLLGLDETLDRLIEKEMLHGRAKSKRGKGKTRHRV